MYVCVYMGQSKEASEISPSRRAVGEEKEGRLGQIRAGTEVAHIPIRMEARSNQSGWWMGTAGPTNVVWGHGAESRMGGNGDHPILGL